MEKTNSKKKNALVPLLICLMLLLALFAYKKTKDYNIMEDAFRKEQSDLQSELDEIIEDYKTVSVKKKALSKRLVKEINKIIALRDSVKNLKATQFRFISKYRRKVKLLEKENKQLFLKIDSLNIVNQTLKDENVIVAQQLDEKSVQSKVLAKTNKQLQEKVAIAGVIKTSPISAIAMKERSSGKLTSTSRSRRTDAFKVNFKMLKNDVATVGEKKIYLQVIDENKNVIASKGTTSLKNGDKIGYSHELVADYHKEDVNILSLILVNRDDIKKGIYTISAFVDGVYSGATTVKLR